MKCYFFLHPHGPAEKAGYEHELIALAEGLTQLGIEVHGNVDYWKIDPQANKFLIEKSGVSHSDCDVVLFSSVIYNYERLDLLPKDLFSKSRRYKLIFVDASDGLITPGFSNELRAADLVLKTHYNKKYDYPGNFSPWQFGLTERIISAVRPLPYAQRKDEVLLNFRVTHQMRDLAEQEMMPAVYQKLKKNTETDSFDEKDFGEKDKLYWTQTGRRHYPSFYKRLGSSKACAAFGGYLEKSISGKTGIAHSVLRKLDAQLNLFEYDRIWQFDSWRFWESLASGCVTLHADFDRYGIVLPVMPENEKHYLGVNFSDLKGSRNKLQQFEKYEAIGTAARDWALENYSPLATARRFLKLIQ